MSHIISRFDNDYMNLPSRTYKQTRMGNGKLSFARVSKQYSDVKKVFIKKGMKALKNLLSSKKPLGYSLY